jgi:hypothetical protein
MVPDMSGADIGEAELSFLIEMQWLTERDAADRRAVGRAIAAMLAASAASSRIYRTKHGTSATNHTPRGNNFP